MDAQGADLERDSSETRIPNKDRQRPYRKVVGKGLEMWSEAEMME